MKYIILIMTLLSFGLSAAEKTKKYDPLFIYYMNEKLKDYYGMLNDNKQEVTSVEKHVEKSNEEFLKKIKKHVSKSKYKEIKKELNKQLSNSTKNQNKDFIKSVKTATTIKKKEQKELVKTISSQFDELINKGKNANLVSYKSNNKANNQNSVIKNNVSTTTTKPKAIAKNVLNTNSKSQTKIQLLKSGTSEDRCFNNNPVKYHNCLMDLSIIDIEKE